MARRLLEGLLLIVTLVGAAYAWQSGQKKSRLTERHRQLALAAVDFPITDTSLIYVRALKTSAPLDFAWHIHLPANCRYDLSKGGPFRQWSGPDKEPKDYIARIHFFRDNEGVLQEYQCDDNTASEGSASKELTSLPASVLDHVRVEQLGKSALAALKPGESRPLLRLTLPEKATNEANPSASDEPSKPLYEMFLRHAPSKP
jgi:hypothetical protein